MTTARDLRERVRRAYGAAAEDPDNKHPFPVGRRFAASLGYPPQQLAELPEVSVDAFAGVSNVAITAEIPFGATVLDLGCGAGLDSLLAAVKTGPLGRVIGVDFCGTMLDRARRGAAEAGLRNIEFLEGDAERLLVADASVDVALANGIFNLNPLRDAVFQELARVVRPGGVVFAAELILRGAQETSQPTDEANWFA